MTIDLHLPLHKVMDLLLDAVCAVDADGRYVFVNAACERLFGYDRKELIGRNMIELVHPDDRQRTLQAASNVMRGNPHLHFENRYVRKDGRVVHIMWSARWSESDRLRLAVARDVTELKRTERVQSALYQISEAAHVAEDLSALCQRVHQIIDDLLPADSFFVALYDDQSGTISFPYFCDERARETEPQPLVAGMPLAEVIRTGQAMLTTNRGAGAIAATESDPIHDSAQWLGVPLISQDGVIGALVVQSHSADARYTDEDKDRLRFVSTQVAAAVERKRTEERLLHMARHDALTDLPNRALFDDRVDTALKRARRYGEHLALLYLDLNGFKEVNDAFGHEVGDRLLLAVAQRLGQCVRESDTVARIGGDEFTVLLTHIRGPEDANVVADKVHAALAAPFDLDGHTLTISASVGTAVYPEQGDQRVELFRHADASMYAAKRRRA